MAEGGSAAGFGIELLRGISSEKRGVATFNGDKLRSIVALDALDEYQVVKSWLEFFRDRGMEQIHMDFLNDNRTSNVAVLLVWTKKATLRQCIRSLHRKFSAGTPKMLIYCAEENGCEDFQIDISLLSTQQDELFTNIFVIHKLGPDVQIMKFLRTLLKAIRDAEFATYPNEYRCISDIIGQDIDASVRVVHSLRMPLRMEAYPLAQCLLTSCSVIQAAVKKFQSQSTNMQVVIDHGGSEDFYENNVDGRVLIISNEKFSNGDLRLSARLDVENLIFLFKKVLGYENVKVERNLTADGMKQSIESFCDGEHGSFGILVVLTHGNCSQLFGSDCKPLSIRALIDTFGKSNGLARKPKLFLIDACRSYVGINSTASAAESLECYDTTSDRIDDITREFNRWYLATEKVSVQENFPARAGLIVAFSTSPGEVSRRLPISGSRFIGSLCWVFIMKANSTDVVSMIENVNYLMTHITDEPHPGAVLQRHLEMQIPSWTVQTAKKFYLAGRSIVRPTPA